MENNKTILLTEDNPDDEALIPRALKKIILTKVIIDSYSQGANSYICKPVEFHNFMQAIQQLGWYRLALNKPPLAAWS